MKTKNPVLVPALLLMGFLVLLESLARLWLPDVPDSIESPRLAYRYRGWPEYMGAPDEAGDAATVVLLTNCQGYGGEYSGSRGYPIRLESGLRERVAAGRGDWEVLNWAIDGATSIEYMIMASYLGRHAPDVVLAVTGYADYRNEHYREGLAYCRSDVPRFLSRPWVVRALPASFRRRHFRLEDWLAYVMSDTLAILRFREFMWSWLDRRFPGVHNVFYAPDFHYLPWSLPKRPLIKSVDLPGREDAPLQVSYGDDSREMLREYMQQLSQIPARVVVIAEPANYDSQNPNEQRFIEDLQRFTEQYHLPYWDLHDALPAEHFLTTAHFHRRNHIRMAGILADRISEMFEEENSASDND